MSKNRGVLPLLLAGAMFLTACGNGEQKQTLISDDLIVPEQANYKTVQAEYGEYGKYIGGSTSVQYLIWANLSWDKSNARFREVLAKPGEQVKQGDVLAVFDIEESKAELENLALQLTSARDEEAAGKKERQSAIDSAEKEAEGLSSHELQIAKLTIGKLQAEYEQFVYQSEREIAQLRKRIEEMEEEAENNQLLAPFDGIIDSVTPYNPGDRVDAGKALVTMYSTDKLFLKVDDSAHNLRYNMRVTVEAGTKDDRKAYSGRVAAASNVLPAAVSQDLALIQLDENITAEELKYSPTYVGGVEQVQNVLLVERRAVSTEEGKSFVYVLEDDMVQKRFIVPGPNNSDVMWILDGLSEGQSLIVD